MTRTKDHLAHSVPELKGTLPSSSELEILRASLPSREREILGSWEREILESWEREIPGSWEREIPGSREREIPGRWEREIAVCMCVCVW